IRTRAIGSMPSQAATSAWLTPSFAAILSTTAACWRVTGSPICRARRSKRRLISRETSWTRKPNARPTSELTGPRSFGAMTALRKGRSRPIRKGFVRAGRTVRSTHPAREPFEIEVDDRCRVQRQPLRYEQPADDRDAERPAQLGAGTLAQRDRQRTEQRRECRYHDRPEAQQAGLVDRLQLALAFEPFRLQRKVEHHDRVLFDNADQQNDADHRNHAQIVMQQH